MTNLPPAFKEYYEISQQMKKLDERRQELSSLMFEYFDDENTKFIPTPLGNFALRERTTYQYSENIKNLEVELKIAKKHEEHTGDAVISKATRFVAFMGKRKQF